MSSTPKSSSSGGVGVRGLYALKGDASRIAQAMDSRPLSAGSRSAPALNTMSDEASSPLQVEDRLRIVKRNRGTEREGSTVPSESGVLNPPEPHYPRCVLDGVRVGDSSVLSSLVAELIDKTFFVDSLNGGGGASSTSSKSSRAPER